MTHDLLVQLAAQRQTQRANRAEWESRTSPTFPRRKVRGRSDRKPSQPPLKEV
jgi:hypothetical protein